MYSMLLSTVSGNGTGTVSNNYLAMGVGLIILAGALGIIIYTTRKKDNGEEMLKEFFELLASKIKEAIIETLNKFSLPDLIHSEEPYEFLISKIYDKVYDTCMENVKDIAEGDNNIILEKITELLTREKVAEYVSVILDKDTDIKDKITELINVANEDHNKELEAEDIAKTEEMKEDVIENLDELEAAGEVVDDEERNTPQLDANFKPIEQKINPPREDDYDPTENTEGTEDI
jgi:hypothetical protein